MVVFNLFTTADTVAVEPCIDTGDGGINPMQIMLDLLHQHVRRFSSQIAIHPGRFDCLQVGFELRPQLVKYLLWIIAIGMNHCRTPITLLLDGLIIGEERRANLD